MSDHVYKLTEIVGTSHTSIEQAIQAALERARTSIRCVRWFEVVTTRGFIDDVGKTQYQVHLKIGFTLDE